MADSLDIDKTMKPTDGGRHAGSLQPGMTLGQYKIIKLLGRGGMGEVYEAEHEVLGLRYALKLLPVDFSTRPGAMDRFKREARIMAQLNHPNIVNADEFGETNGRYWLRMELVEGASLQEYADSLGGKIPQEELLAILKQILAGLAYAHQHGAIHRDLKPSNILLSASRDSVKVADFGLVRLIGEEWVRSQAEISVHESMSIGDERTMGDSVGSSTRSLLGTYEYMSPEQRRGVDADKRSDIYSLGLMTFRLLTGQELSRKSLSRIDSSLVAGWDDLLSEALEPDVSDRLSGCQKFIVMLEAVERLMLGHMSDQDYEESKEREGVKPEGVVEEPRRASGRQGGTAIKLWRSAATGMEFVWVKALQLWVGKYDVTNGEYRKKEVDHSSKDYQGHSLNGDLQPVV